MRLIVHQLDSVDPPGAQEGGTAEITISYLNGHALNVTLARNSGFPVLDAAAFEAGRIAPYPRRHRLLLTIVTPRPSR